MDDSVVDGTFRVLGDKHALPSSTECLEGYVIQSNGDTAVIDLARLEKTELGWPQMISRFKTGELLTAELKEDEGQDRRTSLVAAMVEPEEARAWGLRFGDKVEFEIVTEGPSGKKTSFARILSVWGITDQRSVRSRRVIEDILSGDFRYPEMGTEIPLVKQELFPVQLVTPFSPGTACHIPGGPGSGKSSLFLELATASINWAISHRELRSAVVCLFIGERPQDRNRALEIVRASSNSGIPVYFFGPVRGVAKKYEHRNNAEMALALVERLFELGYHVWFFIDGLRGIIETYRGFPAPNSNYGLTGSGVSTAALEEAIRYVRAGWVSREQGSITSILTALGGFRGQADQAAKELEPDSTSQIALASFEGYNLPYPRLNLPDCEVRNPQILFRGNDRRLNIHVLLREYLASKYRRDNRGIVSNAHEVLAILQELAATGKSWDESIPVWERILTTTQVAVKKYDDQRWRNLVNAIGAITNAPTAVREAALRAAAKAFDMPVYFEADLKQMGAVVVGDEPQVAAPGKSLVAVKESALKEEPAPEEVRETVPAENEGGVDVAMISVQEMMDMWKTLGGQMKLPPPSKVRCKRLMSQEGFVTLAEFEVYIRAGKLR